MRSLHSNFKAANSFLRRRSSSASSLSRVRQRRDQAIKESATIKQQTAGPLNLLTAAKSGGHHQARMTRAGRHSSRRPKARGHSMRRVGAGLAATAAAGSASSREALMLNGADSTTLRSSRRRVGHSRRVHQASAASSRHQLMQHPASSFDIDMMLAWQQRSEGCQSSVQSRMKTSPPPPVGYESYFLLRSFNSDETLLRSSFNCGNLSRYGDFNGNAKRRFSGNDAAASAAPHQSAVVTTMQPRPCDQISEEDYRAVGELGQSQPTIPAAMHQSDILSHHHVEPLMEASFVSLLDTDPRGVFRKSDVSINSQASSGSQSRRRGGNDDCIWIQMRALKELIRALRKLQRQALACGYTMDMAELVEKLATTGGEELNGASSYGDDPAVCTIDHLSALSLIEQIEGYLSVVAYDNNKQEGEDENFSEPLNVILGAKIGLLKQRHTDLKAIRDHYLRSHSGSGGGGGRRRGEQALDFSRDNQNPLSVANRSKSESRIHNHNHNLNSFNSIVGRGVGDADSSMAASTSTTNTNATTSDTAGSRKLSAPSKEIPPISCSSSTSSLAAKRSSQGDGCWPSSATTRPATTTSTNSFGGSGPTHHHHHQLRQTNQSSCKFGSLCPIEFVFNIEKQLAFKRIQGCREVKLNDMSRDQLISEKLELQKNLLRYEHWFGRPTSRLEFSLVGHIYERYRAVKMIKLNRDQPVKSD